MPTSPLQLTRGMAAGEQRAIEDFYCQYFDWLYRSARRATGRDEAFCLDVVQEAVLRIVRCVRPIENEGQLRAWLRLVVQSTAYDLMKSDARRTRREAAVVMPCGGQSTDDPDADDRLAWIRQQIATLAPEIAHMIDLRFQQSWTLARIGRLLGLSIGTVDGRLRKAIGHLRELAREEFDE